LNQFNWFTVNKSIKWAYLLILSYCSKLSSCKLDSAIANRVDLVEKQKLN
jgi:hypothetical protein